MQLNIKAFAFPNANQRNYSITGRGLFNPICPSFVTHSVTQEMKKNRTVYKKEEQMKKYLFGLGVMLVGAGLMFG